MALRQICRMRRQLISYDPVFHVFLVGQTQVLLWRYVTEHRRAKPPNHRRAYRGRNVIVTRRDVGGQWTKRVERCLMTSLELLVHVLFDQVHRHVTWSLNNHLAIVL